jgi:hypothetical protein
MHAGDRGIHLRTQRGDLSGRGHQGQGHRFGTEAIELLYEFFRAGPLEDGLNSLLDLGVVIVLRATHAILDNTIQIMAPV